MSSRSSEPPRKPLRRLLPWLLAGVIGLILYQALSGPRGLLRISELRAQKQQILREIDSLQTRKSELLAEKKRLLTDTAYLEKLARKELGMAKPGEKVYRFVKPAPAAPGDPKPAAAPAP